MKASTTPATASAGKKSTATKKKATMEDIESEIDLDPTSYSGTFRWKATKALPHLPPFPPMHTFLNLQESWKGYFDSRGGDALVMQALNDLCLVDCLSFVLTIPYFLHVRNVFGWNLSTSDPIPEPTKGQTASIDEYSPFYCQDMQFEALHLLCMGCSKKAEERVLLESNVYAELLLCFPHIRHIHLWLIGPEISHTEEEVVRYGNHDNGNAHCAADLSDGHLPMLHGHLFQGTMMEFLRQHPEYLNQQSHPSLIVGYNCGFGNFENPLPRRYDLFANWYQDLLFLTGTQLPALFTCANDYADLFGEVNILCNLFGSNLIDAPSSNPFGFASTMIPPSGQDGENSFARGNSFFHAVQGHVKERRLRIPGPNTASGKDAWLAKIIPIVHVKNLHSMIVTNVAYYMKEELATLKLNPFTPSSTTNPLFATRPEIAPRKVIQRHPNAVTVVSSNESVTSQGNESSNDANSTSTSASQILPLTTQLHSATMAAHNKKKRRKKKLHRLSDRVSETSEDTYATSTVRSDSPLTTTTENTEYAHSILEEAIEEAIALEGLNLRDDPVVGRRQTEEEEEEEAEEARRQLLEASSHHHPVLPRFDQVYTVLQEDHADHYVLHISHASPSPNQRYHSDLKQVDIQLHTSGKQLLLSNYVQEEGRTVSVKVDQAITLPHTSKASSVQAKYSKKKDTLSITIHK